MPDEKTVQAEFVVTSQGVIPQGQPLPEGLPEEEMAHIESTGALEEGGVPATDAVDAAYGTKSGSEENYLGETPPDPPEEEEPLQPPFETSDEAEEFYGSQPTRGEYATTFTAEGGVRRPEPSPVVNQKGERVTPQKPNLGGEAPRQTPKTKLAAKKDEKEKSAPKQPERQES
jgi:hypothetical protein